MKALFPILIVLLVVGFIVWGFVRKRKQEKAMADAATTNGWTPLSPDLATLGQYVPQYLQDMRAIRTNYDMAYSAKAADYEIIFFQYSYTIVEQTYNAQTNQEERHDVTYTFAVMTAKLKATWPKLLLLHHSFMSKIANFTDHFGLQALSLEGNFNDQFDCYITPNTQVQALSLLTPDVMERIQDWDKKASMQVVGSQIMTTIETSQFTPEVTLQRIQKLADITQKINAKPVSEANA